MGDLATKWRPSGPGPWGGRGPDDGPGLGVRPQGLPPETNEGGRRADLLKRGKGAAPPGKSQKGETDPLGIIQIFGKNDD